jgi:N-acetyl-anhydromuramyl-L-alanine amidase AmpD
MTIIEKTYAWAYPLTKRTVTDCIVLHHAAVTTATPDQIHAAHLANGWSGIAYHYYVRKDGSIYRGRPENTIGGHTKNENYHTIGVCFEGNYMTETMPDAQKDAGKWLVQDIKTRYPDIDVKRHKDFNPTGCPGDNFPFDEISGGDNMTGEEIYNKLNEYLTTLPVPDWAKEEFEKAVSAGITDGTAPMALTPRYQSALLAYRASLK